MAAGKSGNVLKALGHFLSNGGLRSVPLWAFNRPYHPFKIIRYLNPMRHPATRVYLKEEEKMRRYSIRKCLFVLAVTGFLVSLSIRGAQAVPSFARQTGMSCTTCHTVWPELTPFGRTFKTGGFTFSSASEKEPYRPPIAAMFQASATFLNDNDGILTSGVAPFDNSKDSATDQFNLPQQASIFYGG